MSLSRIHWYNFLCEKSTVTFRKRFGEFWCRISEILDIIMFWKKRIVLKKRETLRNARISSRSSKDPSKRVGCNQNPFVILSDRAENEPSEVAVRMVLAILPEYWRWCHQGRAVNQLAADANCEFFACSQLGPLCSETCDKIWNDERHLKLKTRTPLRKVGSETFS